MRTTGRVTRSNWSLLLFLGGTVFLALAFSVFVFAATDTTDDPPNPLDFEHSETGFPLDGQHELLACEECHFNSVFDALRTECAACHDGTMAVGQPPTHIITSAPCESCHEPTGFAISAAAIFDHSVVGNQPCNACHNGVIATGKNTQHVSTTNNCDKCHTSQAWIPITTFDHAEGFGSCASCHDGISARGKGPTHVPTNDPCEVCHNTRDWFAAFDHRTVAGQPCAQSGCHDGTGTGSGKSTAHPLTSNLCEGCHRAGGSFLPTLIPIDHTQAFDACVNCHNNVVATGKGPTHIPTTLACDVCHNTTSWLTVQFDHTLVAGQACAGAGCHDGASGVSGKGPAHPPSSEQCQSCHSTTVWIPVLSPMDHSQTTAACNNAGCHDGASSAAGKGPSHPSTTEACETCHSSTTWLPVLLPFRHDQAIFTSCAGVGCHSSADKNPTHPLSTDACEACHNTGVWLPLILPFAHDQASDVCSNCHNGVRAIGKGQTHVPTTAECDVCHHSTLSFLDSVFDHGTVVGQPCAQSGCHDGTGTGLGKPLVHPLTTDACESCHQFSGWALLLTPFNHTQTTAACFSAGCHDGLGQAAGKSGNHPPSSNNCQACHSDTAWIPLLSPFAHSETTAACFSAGCHDGASVAAGKGANHPVTTDACELCHSNTVWSPPLLPFNHGQTTDTCIACHNNTIATGKSANHPASVDTCELCHTQINYLTLVSPFDHAQTSAACNAAGCHDGVSARTTKSAGHPLSSDLCEGCHNQQAWIPPLNPIDHSQTTAACENCHDNVIARGKGPTHISTTAACDVCHNTTSWMGAFDHSLVAGQPCAQSGCHDGTGTATYKSPSHPSTSENCAACHISTSWTNLILPFAHTETTAPCEVCHNNTIATGKGPTHVPTNAACDVCHTTAGWTGAAFDHSTVAGQACTSAGCHDGVSARTFKSAGHPVSSNLCQACHTTNNWTPLNPIDHTQTTDACENCHNNVIATGKGPTHIATTLPCDQCHNTSTWLGAAFDHASVAGQACTSSGCHDGVSTRTFKSASHPASTLLCERCHTTTNWNPLNPIDHSQTTAACDVCHNNVVAIGKGPTHLPTTLPCDNCHTTNSWANASFNHALVAGQPCAQSGCHDGISGPTFKSVSHPTTTNLCEACHTSNNWNPRNPIDHSQTTDACENCHNNVIATGKGPTHLPTTLPCDSCHTTNTWLGATFNHALVAGQPCAQSGCHDGISGATFKSLSHPVTSNVCEACHTSNNWNPLNPIDHSQTTDACENCHNNVVAIGKGPTHIPTTLPCDACHSTNTWAGAVFNHATVAGQPCTQSGCHDGVSATGFPFSTHFAVSANVNCGVCHTAGGSWLNAGNNHNFIDPTGAGIGVPTCMGSGCHTNADKGAGHCTTTLDCAQCHWSPTNAAWPERAGAPACGSTTPPPGPAPAPGPGPAPAPAPGPAPSPAPGPAPAPAPGGMGMGGMGMGGMGM